MDPLPLASKLHLLSAGLRAVATLCMLSLKCALSRVSNQTALELVLLL